VEDSRHDSIRWHPRVTVERYSPEQAAWAERWLAAARAWGHKREIRATGLLTDVLHGDLLRELFPHGPEDGLAYDEGNQMVNGGLTNLINLVTGTSPSGTNSRPLTLGSGGGAAGSPCVGVGTDGSTAFSVTQTHLANATGEGSANSYYQTMDAGYPTLTTPATINGQSTFAPSAASFTWAEWPVYVDTANPFWIMTRAGWKQYDELTIGEDVLTLDAATGLSRWTPLLGATLWPDRMRRLRVAEGRWAGSAAWTEDHRWPVAGPAGLDWRTSASLAEGDRLLRAVQHAGFSAETKYADDFVRLVAHYWCDGWHDLRHGRAAPQYRAGMGARREDKIASMRRALRVLPPGSWGEDASRDGTAKFRFNQAARQVLDEAAPGRLPSYAFLGDLTEAQLRLFAEICIELGDGGVANGARYFDQTDKHGDGIGRMEYACALLGIPTQGRVRALSPGRFGKLPHTRLALHSQRNSLVAVGDSLGERWEETGGRVWCPRTVDGNWLCRQGGSVFWTGNCWAAGAGVPTAGPVLSGVYATSGSGVMMNRKIPSAPLGTKFTGAAWVFVTSTSFT
jgi:hypothetical protein